MSTIVQTGVVTGMLRCAVTAKVARLCTITPAGRGCFFAGTETCSSLDLASPYRVPAVTWLAAAPFPHARTAPMSRPSRVT
jgi:hypothetical protein